MLDEVKNAMTEVFGTAPDTVTMETGLNDLDGWDSMGHLNLMLHFEREKGIEINEETILQCTTVRGIIDYFENRA